MSRTGCLPDAAEVTLRSIHLKVHPINTVTDNTGRRHADPWFTTGFRRHADAVGGSQNYAANAARRVHADLARLQGRCAARHQRIAGNKSKSANPELRRRERSRRHCRGCNLARRHQELRAVDARSGRPSAGRRQPLGGTAVASRCRCTGFAEGEVSKAKATNMSAAIQHAESCAYYSGPCTPPGAPHHYIFTLDRDRPRAFGALKPGLTRDELFKALDGHVKGATGLIGTFSKP